MTHCVYNITINDNDSNSNNDKCNNNIIFFNVIEINIYNLKSCIKILPVDLSNGFDLRLQRQQI